MTKNTTKTIIGKYTHFGFYSSSSASSSSSHYNLVNIRIRCFASYQRSILQLSDDIDLVYKYLTEINEDSV